MGVLLLMRPIPSDASISSRRLLLREFLLLGYGERLAGGVKGVAPSLSFVCFRGSICTGFLASAYPPLAGDSASTAPGS